MRTRLNTIKHNTKLFPVLQQWNSQTHARDFPRHVVNFKILQMGQFEEIRAVWVLRNTFLN